MTISTHNIRELRERLDDAMPDWIQVKQSRDGVTLEFEAMIGARLSRSLEDCIEIINGDDMHIGDFITEAKQQITSELNNFFVEKHAEFGVYGPKPEVPTDKALSVLRDNLYSSAQFVEGPVSASLDGVSHSDAVQAIDTLEEYFDQNGGTDDR